MLSANSKFPTANSLADRPSTQYEAARDAQNAQLTMLEDAIAELEKRLQPVLGSYGSDSEGAKAKEAEASAQLIAGMRHHTSRIEVINERVRELLDRLCI